MVEVVVSALAVVGVFAVVASLLMLYVWRCDPHQFTIWKAEFAMWRTALRGENADGEAPARRPRKLPKLRFEVTSAPAAEEATEPPVVPVRKSPSARLDYWVDK